jgi:CheY-like chemotaxis protein
MSDCLSAGNDAGGDLVATITSDSPNRVKPMERSENAPSLCVLVVDDCRDTTASLAMLLEVWGHRVCVANDGPSALRAAAEHRPHVVLLDIAMPRMNGLEVARRLRQTPGLEKVFLVALTGYGDTESRRRSHEAGCNLHLLKPVEPQQIERLLELYREELSREPLTAEPGAESA